MAKEIAKDRVSIERERLELDRERLAIEKRFFHRHLGVLISATVTLAVAILSFTQWYVAKGAEENEKTRLKNEKTRLAEARLDEHEKAKLEHDRRFWRSALLNYLEENSEEIFSEDQEERERARQLLVVGFPDHLAEEVVKKIELSVSESARQTWADARRALQKLPDDAQIEFRCLNPEINLDVPVHNTDSKGRGQATTERVQFNVNRGPVSGAIFVNVENNGVCTATIHSDHRVTNGRAKFDPPGIYDQSVQWDKTIAGDKEIVFHVKRVTEDVGNVTMAFIIDYEKTN